MGLQFFLNWLYSISLKELNVNFILKQEGILIFSLNSEDQVC